uniref:Uncharacterized protein LOC101507098 isoform X2 n=1 Tax=Cicer arietinum TaxID=3827 RepID=A0A3Q7YFE0_CICAR|nr:uncharacterized protein LOC101507098 isoform X2 [Cicer arietinum]
MLLTTSDNKPRNRTWDREHDLYIYLQNNNTVLKTQTNDFMFNHFNTLLQKFVVRNPKADSELMQFTDGSSSILQSLLLHLQNQNRENTAEENVTEDEEEHNRYLLNHLKPCGKSYLLEIIEDGVFVKYEDESSDSKKCSSKGKKLKGAKVFAAKKRGVKINSGGNCKRKRVKMNHVIVNVNGEGASNVKDACFEQTEGQHIGSGKKGEQSDTPSCMEVVKVKDEISDYDYVDDDDVIVIERPVQSLVGDDFRGKLLNELNRPYCEEECQRLLRDFKVRKPVQNYKDLRGRIKIYEEDYDGKSFYDHTYEEIEAAGDDHPKVLSLLRGYFFWLKNASHEGEFMPWRVPSFLDVLPQQ